MLPGDDAVATDGALESGLRVVHVASGREWRGGQHQVLLLARGLRDAGVDTIVVTGEGSELAGRLEAADVPAALCRWSSGLDPRVALCLAGQVTPSTIVHAHDSHSHVIADAITRMRGATMVVTRRVDFPIRSGARFRRANAVIAISRAVRERLLSAGVDPLRIHIVPDGVEPESPAPPPPADALPGPLMVCIATLTDEKGVDVLLDAAAVLHASHPHARWLVVGAGVRRAALLTQRRRLRLDAVVEFNESIAPRAAFAAATLAVQPSRSEGLGSAVLLALQCGIPVVASNVGGLPDALARGGGVVVPPDAPTELAAAVRGLLDNTVRRAQLATAGRAAATFFGVVPLVERTMHVYRSVEPQPRPQ